MYHREIAVVDSFQIHSYEKGEGNYVFIIPLCYCNDYFNSKAEYQLDGNIIRDTETLDKIWGIIDDLKSPPPNELMFKGLINQFLGLTVQNLGLVKSSSTTSILKIREIFNYIQHNFQSPITLDDISKRFSYNKCYISHVINQTLHMNFNTYLNNMRLSYFIIEYRKAPNCNIGELAFHSGFNSLQTFYRAFSKSFGMSPSEYFHTQRPASECLESLTS